MINSILICMMVYVYNKKSLSPTQCSRNTALVKHAKNTFLNQNIQFYYIDFSKIKYLSGSRT